MSSASALHFVTGVLFAILLTWIQHAHGGVIDTNRPTQPEVERVGGAAVTEADYGQLDTITTDRKDTFFSPQTWFHRSSLVHAPAGERWERERHRSQESDLRQGPHWHRQSSLRSSRKIPLDATGDVARPSEEHGMRHVEPKSILNLQKGGSNGTLAATEPTTISRTEKSHLEVSGANAGMKAELRSGKDDSDIAHDMPANGVSKGSDRKEEDAILHEVHTASLLVDLAKRVNEAKQQRAETSMNDKPPAEEPRVNRDNPDQRERSNEQQTSSEQLRQAMKRHLEQSGQMARSETPNGSSRHQLSSAAEGQQSAGSVYYTPVFVQHPSTDRIDQKQSENDQDDAESRNSDKLKTYLPPAGVDKTPTDKKNGEIESSTPIVRTSVQPGLGRGHAEVSTAEVGRYSVQFHNSKDAHSSGVDGHETPAMKTHLDSQQEEKAQDDSATISSYSSYSLQDMMRHPSPHEKQILAQTTSGPPLAWVVKDHPVIEPTHKFGSDEDSESSDEESSYWTYEGDTYVEAKSSAASDELSNGASGKQNRLPLQREVPVFPEHTGKSPLDPHSATIYQTDLGKGLQEFGKTGSQDAQEYPALNSGYSKVLVKKQLQDARGQKIKFSHRHYASQTSQDTSSKAQGQQGVWIKDSAKTTPLDVANANAHTSLHHRTAPLASSGINQGNQPALRQNAHFTHHSDHLKETAAALQGLNSLMNLRGRKRRQTLARQNSNRQLMTMPALRMTGPANGYIKSGSSVKPSRQQTTPMLSHHMQGAAGSIQPPQTHSHSNHKGMEDNRNLNHNLPSQSVLPPRNYASRQGPLALYQGTHHATGSHMPVQDFLQAYSLQQSASQLRPSVLQRATPSTGGRVYSQGLNGAKQPLARASALTPSYFLTPPPSGRRTRHTHHNGLHHTQSLSNNVQAPVSQNIQYNPNAYPQYSNGVPLSGRIPNSDQVIYSRPQQLNYSTSLYGNTQVPQVPLNGLSPYYQVVPSPAYAGAFQRTMPAAIAPQQPSLQHVPVYSDFSQNQASLLQTPRSTHVAHQPVVPEPPQYTQAYTPGYTLPPVLMQQQSPSWYSAGAAVMQSHIYPQQQQHAQASQLEYAALGGYPQPPIGQGQIVPVTYTVGQGGVGQLPRAAALGSSAFQTPTQQYTITGAAAQPPQQYGGTHRGPAAPAGSADVPERPRPQTGRQRTKSRRPGAGASTSNSRRNRRRPVWPWILAGGRRRESGVGQRLTPPAVASRNKYGF